MLYLLYDWITRKDSSKLLIFWLCIKREEIEHAAVLKFYVFLPTLLCSPSLELYDNNNTTYWTAIYDEPRIVLRPLGALFHSIITTSLWRRDYFYFLDKERKTQNLSDIICTAGIVSGCQCSPLSLEPWLLLIMVLSLGYLGCHSTGLSF